MNASVGYYYQNGDLGTADGSGVLGRLAYEKTSGVTAGVNLSYDEAFETRVSADLKVRFGGASTTAMRKEVKQLPVISALICHSSSVSFSGTTPSKPGRPCKSQAGGNGARRSGEAQQASATRATMTMVAVMGSMGCSWVAFNLPDPIERTCDQPHSPA